jgi:hypothetical protein
MSRHDTQISQNRQFQILRWVTKIGNTYAALLHLKGTQGALSPRCSFAFCILRSAFYIMRVRMPMRMK